MNFIENSKKIHNNKYDYSLVNYINNKTKVKIICPKHGIFEQIPYNHTIKKQGCPKCSFYEKTNKNFIENSKKIHNNKYDYSLVNYINNKTKVKIICPVHGGFEQLPINHCNRKQGCPTCNIENIKQIFINVSEKIHNNKYDYSIVNYINNNTKIKIICKEHDIIFEQLPKTHIKGSMCPYCNGRIILNKKDFIEKSKIIHNNKYDYSLVDYNDNYKKVKIICNQHDIFEQTPYKHLNNIGCPYCNGKIILNKKDFIEKSKIIHNKYDYSLVDYKNNNTKVNIICIKHGIFEQTPYNHTHQKQGCPKCNNSKGEIEIKKLLIDNNINYEEQKIFNKCVYKKQLKFDFYLPEHNICIEYDGEQHFKKYKFEKNNKNLEIRKKRDKIKNIYCKDNNINLYRINYKDNIKNKLLEIINEIY